jgi:hypothetical protein
VNAAIVECLIIADARDTMFGECIAQRLAGGFVPRLGFDVEPGDLGGAEWSPA